MNKLILTFGILISGLTMLSGQVTCSAHFYEHTDTSLTASFISANSSATNGMTEYSTWDFGDGQSISYSGNKFSIDHTYSSAGWYVVKQNVVITDFRSDTICSSVFSDSIPIGFVYNPNGWIANLSVPDTLKGYSLMAVDSSPNYTNTVPVIQELAFYEKGAAYYRQGIGLSTSIHGGNGSKWPLRNQGYNKIYLSKRIYDSGVLLNEVYDSKNVYVDPPVTSTASITYTQNPSVHGEVSFTAVTSSSPIDTSIQAEAWSWSFGDGSSGKGKVITHTFPGAGEYRVVLAYMVKNKNTNMVEGYSRVVDTVVIQPAAYCSADFDFKQHGRMDNKSLNYYSPNSAGVRYEWYFEDGTTSTDKNPYHSLTKYANSIKLVQVVEDAQYNVLCSDTVTHIVYNPGGINPPCLAEYKVDSALSGNSVITIVNSSRPQPADTGYSWINYIWDFGDGTTSNQAFPTHVYADSGTYNLCLTVETLDNNGDSCSSSFCKTVGVDSLGNIIYKNSGGFTINVVAPNGTVGQEDYDKLDVSIYPNPASDYIKVEGIESATNWSLFNIQGVQVGEGMVDSENNNIDVSKQKAGLYLINLGDGGWSKTYKVLVK